MTSYYNEIDKPAAAWLRELIKAGHIADGIVDERDIQDVLPSDLDGFTQCHFFAGIGVWSYALRNSGWADDRPVWTGSCPCQPFSSAGKGSAFADERHLWPAFHHLIKECRPPVVFGEQVASKDADTWIDLVQADMEGEGYACGAVDTCAAGFGAPHIRQRLYWAAYTSDQRQHGRWASQTSDGRDSARVEPERLCDAGGLDDSKSERSRFLNTENIRPTDAQIDILANASDSQSNQPHRERLADSSTGPTNGFWRDADWLLCRDGKWRPVEPGSFPLVDGAAARVVRGGSDGLPIDSDKTGEARVMRLRGYGNSINAVAAKAFIESFMDYQQQVSA